MGAPSRVTAFVETVASEFSDKNVPFLAASLAYTAFVSLVPLLLFFFLVLALVEAGWEDRFRALVVENVSPTVGRLIEHILRDQASGAIGSSIVGLVVLVWGVLKLFRSLDTAFGAIYEVDADGSFLDQVKDGAVVLLSLVLAVTAVVAGTSAFGTLSGRVPYVGLFVPLALVVGLAIALLPMFYVFPNVPVSVREVVPGVVVTATGWALLQALFQVYVAVSTGDGTSLVTGIMLLLTWLYVGGVVLLLGVVVNAVVGGHAESETGGPAPTPAATG